MDHVPYTFLESQRCRSSSVLLQNAYWSFLQHFHTQHSLFDTTVLIKVAQSLLGSEIFCLL